MAFKQKIPIPALVFALLAVGLGAVVVFHRPPDEDLLRQAVDKYVASLGAPPRQMEIHGTTVDLITADGRLVYAQFEKKNGEWAYARNLAEEFSRAMKDPAFQKQVRDHLAEKVANRFQAATTVLPELSQFEYSLARDLTEDVLVGSVRVGFSYPKTGDLQKRGQYIEQYRWQDGRWQSQGLGALYDYVGR